MQATRRTVLKATAAATAVAAVGGVRPFPSRTAGAAELAAPEGTTLDSTVVRATPDPERYTLLVSGPGEPHAVLEELGTKARPGRAGRRRSVLSFVHLTDIHVIDAQSPARVEFLDRYNDGPGSALIFSSAYRPQEMLMAQMSDAMVAAVRRQAVGPVTGRRFDFAICTGDNTDNAQLNETRWHIDVLDGRPVQANSGDPKRFEGVMDLDAASYDPHYWHPDGTPSGKPEDFPKLRYGFPKAVPGLLDAAIRPFEPVGLPLPWYSCFGNHDGLVQGNFPYSFQLTRVAEGPLKPVSLPPNLSPEDFTDPRAEALQGLAAAPARVVTPDPGRRILTRTQYVQEHFKTGGLPVGHGYKQENVDNGTAYYVFDPSPQVRGIVLDTVNPNGESSGSLDERQFAWLGEQLKKAEAERKLVLVFSHHPSTSLTNRIVFVDDPQRRVLGPEVVARLLEHRNVVAWVNGHSHRNSVTARRRPDGTGGFWEVNTAAHVDWPCQSRLLELTDNGDGTLSLFCTMLDPDAPLQGRGTSTPRELAGLARELAANDWQDRSDGPRGDREDRNVELLLAAPFAVAAPPRGQQPGREAPVPAGGSLPATGAAPALAAAAAGATVAGLAARR